VFCEGWTSDLDRKEVNLTSGRECDNACPALCDPSPITALPSIRVGNYEHVVLGFSISNACVPECIGVEPCYNIGVSYRHPVSSTTQASQGAYICDLEPVFSGARFTGTYTAGGTDTITISNVMLTECGGPPASLDLTGRGPSLGIDSHFDLNWVGDEVGGYVEARTYTKLGVPNVVHITVTNIDYVAHTFDVDVQGAETPTRPSSWGRLKVLYR
jgi:hypothetical protein